MTETTGQTPAQRQLTEEALAAETESGATDEVIELEGSNEAMPARGAPNSLHSPQALTAEEEADTSRHQAGTKTSVPATQAHEIDNQRKPLLHPSEAQSVGIQPAGSLCSSATRGDPESRSTAHRSSPTRPTSDTGEEVIDVPAPQAAAQPKLQEIPSTHSKAPEVTEQQKGRAPEHAMIDALQSRRNVPPPPATGLLSIAATRPTATAVMNPKMPAAATNDSGAHMPRKDEAPMMKIFLEETDDRAGTVDADITHLAEQRAMRTVLQYQMQALRHSAPADSSSVLESTALAPIAPPLSLYANLPQKWPLARLSVQLRHIGVVLRVTLFRRVAELNFRGVEVRRLPREVMTSVIHDFNNIAGELARRPASLFHFLKSVPSANKQADELGLTLYAEPKYWFYGLPSFCAKACEAKIEEANGRPVQKAKKEGGVPDLEATGKTLALMQTVAMSFGRNQRLGTPDLPIHHLHVYFPVQLVRKLIARMRTDLHFTEATQEKGNYKHNSESETNSPYIVVGTCENECRPNTSYGATLPDTPSLAVAYEQGLLDGNLGHSLDKARRRFWRTR